ncbi:MAG: hypothetical protein Q8Q52_05790 [Acidimicrobiia bacterium]|nr:hypothetical protein [Acidimicrobiia bacterium]
MPRTTAGAVLHGSPGPSAPTIRWTSSDLTVATGKFSDSFNLAYTNAPYVALDGDDVPWVVYGLSDGVLPGSVHQLHVYRLDTSSVVYRWIQWIQLSLTDSTAYPNPLYLLPPKPATSSRPAIAVEGLRVRASRNPSESLSWGASGSTIHLVYAAQDAGEYQRIYYTSIDEATGNASGAILVSGDKVACQRPSLVLDTDGTVHIAFIGQTPLVSGDHGSLEKETDNVIEYDTRNHVFYTWVSPSGSTPRGYSVGLPDQVSHFTPSTVAQSAQFPGVAVRLGDGQQDPVVVVCWRYNPIGDEYLQATVTTRTAALTKTTGKVSVSWFKEVYVAGPLSWSHPEVSADPMIILGSGGAFHVFFQGKEIYTGSPDSKIPYVARDAWSTSPAMESSWSRTDIYSGTILKKLTTGFDSFFVYGAAAGDALVATWEMRNTSGVNVGVYVGAALSGYGGGTGFGWDVLYEDISDTFADADDKGGINGIFPEILLSADGDVHVFWLRARNDKVELLHRVGTLT